MNKNYIKVIFQKDYIASEYVGKEKLAEYYYFKALQEFVYDTKGCIAGWERAEITDDKTIIAYSCTTYDYGISDKGYLLKDIDKLREFFNIKIDDSLETSGEMIVYFEN